jgi:hypothetical protein
LDPQSILFSSSFSHLNCLHSGIRCFNDRWLDLHTTTLVLTRFAYITAFFYLVRAVIALSNHNLLPFDNLLVFDCLSIEFFLESDAVYLILRSARTLSRDSSFFRLEPVTTQRGHNFGKLIISVKVIVLVPGEVF